MTNQNLRTLWIRPYGTGWCAIDMKIMDKHRNPIILGVTRFRWMAIKVCTYFPETLHAQAKGVKYRRLIICNAQNRIEKRISLNKPTHAK